VKPFILEETNDFAVLFKPPRMHCVPLKSKQNVDYTLLDWYAELFPPAPDTGGLVHRLDFETQGLVLVAKNNKSFELFKFMQNNGDFVKEYSARCVKTEPPALDTGFPPAPVFPGFNDRYSPFVIESYFRPFGPGRKQVRPVTETGNKKHKLAKDKGSYYRTEITGICENCFTIRIKRGFRHQIRCHLAWIGYPIMNDPVYGPEKPACGQPNQVQDMGDDFLMLCAHALFFIDPSTGLRREYRIASNNEQGAENNQEG
jgi:23S rRNA pseudouridine1911/1915/1917 synthase